MSADELTAARLVIDGSPAPFRVQRVHGRERIHAPFSFEVTCSVLAESLVLADLATHDATLSWPYADGSSRTINAVVDALENHDGLLRVTLSPKLALLDDTLDHRVFLDEDAVASATTVLSEHGLTVDPRVSGTLRKHPQRVQAFESALAFVTRILAADGLAFVLPVDRSDHVIVCDDPGGFDDLPGESFTFKSAGASLHGETVQGLVIRHARSVQKVVMRDYDFTRPRLNQEVTAGDGTLEWYEYPGGYVDPSVGSQLAALRLAQLQAGALVLEGSTSSRRLAPGYVITIEGSPREEHNGRWLILSVEHDLNEHNVGTDRFYTARFRAVSADAGFKPGRVAPPRLGFQTTTVTGPSGSEIHTEEHGRSKVHLRWDRRRPLDDTSSTWVRVVQPPTSGGMLIPRMTWEALVAFQGESGDAPVILGRLYNGVAKPPSGLPGNKVVSAFGTATTPGGGSKNGITMNDTAGSEGFAIVASKDFNEKTENDKAIDVTANDTTTVGSNRKIIVGNILQVNVTGSQTYSVAATRTVNTDANKAIAAASETVMIGGLRAFDVGGDYTAQCATLTRLVGAAKMEAAIESQNRVVTGASTVLVGGSWTCVGAVRAAVKVLGASTELVGGVKSIKAPKYKLTVKGALNETLATRTVTAGGDRIESFGAAASYNVAGSFKAKGTKIVFKASGSITIKGPGITLKLTPSECSISGKFKSSVSSADDGDESYE